MSKVIAYVEDDKDIIDLVAIILERQGYTVEGFTDSPEVWDQLENLNPDLILLDIMMPRIDGFEVYDGLKKRDTTSSIPIVVVSAMKKAIEEIQQESRIEVEGCLVKPFTIGELSSMVKEVLEL